MNKNKTIWIKGTNEHYKKPILFKCVCKIEGDKILLGDPFIKGGFPLSKFENNTEEKPFNYMIAIDTYEKAINKENPFIEFYDYYEKVINTLEKQLKSVCEAVNRDISSDYKGIYFKLKDNRALGDLRININRKSITKLNLEYENPFNRERIKKEILKNEFEYFKDQLEEFKKFCLNLVEESKKENTYFKKCIEFFNNLKEFDITDTYEISLRCHEFLDRLSIYFRVVNFEIPKKFNDSINKSNSFSVNIEENKIYLQNGSEQIEEKHLKSFDNLKKFILNTIQETKKSKISKEKAKNKLYELKEEEDKKTKLTEEKFEDFLKRFKEKDKITIYGAEGLFSCVTFEGRIHEISKENKSFMVIAKGKRNRGLRFRIGSYYERSERGYLK